MTPREVVLLNNQPPQTGLGRYAYTLYLHLAKLGLHVTFVSWDKDIFNWLYHSLRAVGLNAFYYLLKFKYLSTKLRVNVPLIHITNGSYLVSIVPSLRRRKSNIKIVVTVHDLVQFVAPRCLADSYNRKKMLSIIKADRIICISESTKRDLLRCMHVDSEKARTIYYGVDHELFRPRDKFKARRKLKLPLDRPIILSVASEEPRKNIPVLLKSFKKLLMDVPNALLVRVGEKTAQIEKLIRDMDLSDRVLYRRASPFEVALYYNAADLLCFPSYYEGFGFPPLEAMASGLPVIASNVSSIPEVVGDAGVLLNPFDVDGFAYWMREVLLNEDLRVKLSEKGYRRSMNFSWEKCAKETLDVYREALE
jgi:glycosyltransferase involved in cell wall biosynthesis